MTDEAGWEARWEVGAKRRRNALSSLMLRSHLEAMLDELRDASSLTHEQAERIFALVKEIKQELEIKRAEPFRSTTTPEEA